jgi:hypothetical protein
MKCKKWAIRTLLPRNEDPKEENYKDVSSRSTMD